MRRAPCRTGRCRKEPRLLDLGVQPIEARRRIRRELGRIEVGEIGAAPRYDLRVELERERNVVFGKRRETHRGRDFVRLAAGALRRCASRRARPAQPSARREFAVGVVDLGRFRPGAADRWMSVSPAPAAGTVFASSASAARRRRARHQAVALAGAVDLREDDLSARRDAPERRRRSSRSRRPCRGSQAAPSGVRELPCRPAAAG